MATATKYDAVTGANTIDESIRRAKIMADVHTPAMIALGVMSEKGSVKETFSDTFVQGAPAGKPVAATLVDNDSTIQRSALTENRVNYMEMTPVESKVRNDVRIDGGTVGNFAKPEQQMSANEGYIYQRVEQRLGGNTASLAPTGDKSGLCGSPATFGSHYWRNWSAGTDAESFLPMDGYNATTKVTTKVPDATATGTNARADLSVRTILRLVSRIKRQTGSSVMGRSGSYGTKMARVILIIPSNTLDGLIAASPNGFSSLNRISSNMDGVGRRGGTLVAHATVIRGKDLEVMLIATSLPGGDDNTNSSTAGATKSEIGVAIYAGCTSVVFAKYPTSEVVKVGAVNAIATTYALWGVKPILGELVVPVTGLLQEGA